MPLSDLQNCGPKPSSFNLIQDLKPSVIILLPGRIKCLISPTNVSLVLEYTFTIKHHGLKCVLFPFLVVILAGIFIQLCGSHLLRQFFQDHLQQHSVVTMIANFMAISKQLTYSVGGGVYCLIQHEIRIMFLSIGSLEDSNHVFFRIVVLFSHSNRRGICASVYLLPTFTQSISQQSTQFPLVSSSNNPYILQNLMHFCIVHKKGIKFFQVKCQLQPFHTLSIKTLTNRIFIDLSNMRRIYSLQKLKIN